MKSKRKYKLADLVRHYGSEEAVIKLRCKGSRQTFYNWGVFGLPEKEDEIHALTLKLAKMK